MSEENGKKTKNGKEGISTRSYISLLFSLPSYDHYYSFSLPFLSYSLSTSSFYAIIIIIPASFFPLEIKVNRSDGRKWKKAECREGETDDDDADER